MDYPNLSFVVFAMLAGDRVEENMKKREKARQWIHM